LPINILKEPRDRIYEKLIQHAFKVCKTFILAMQREILMYYPEPEILKKLEPFKIDEVKALYYPKIEYYNHEAMFYFYKCNEETESIIMKEVSGLYEWRYPDLPEDLTFLDDKGDVWMNSISHESMAGINETDRNEVEFIRNEIGLEIEWREKIYTEDEVGEAMDSLFNLIEEYFYLLGNYSEEELIKELSNKDNSAYYGFWNDFYGKYAISEHCLAFEIARFSNLLRLSKPIYAFDFSSLLNDRIDNRYLVQSLTLNTNGNSKLVSELIEGFKLKYGMEK
jgi:hypothetical protein